MVKQYRFINNMICNIDAKDSMTSDDRGMKYATDNSGTISA